MLLRNIEIATETQNHRKSGEVAAQLFLPQILRRSQYADREEFAATVAGSAGPVELCFQQG